MSYVRKVIAGDEKLLSISHLHWIYVFEGVFWFAAVFGFGLFLDHNLWLYFGSYGIGFNFDFWIFQFDERHTPLPWMFGAAGFAVFWPLLLKYISTEIGLTDKRIIHKKGLIMIEVQQIDLEDIRAENVNHGWLGWLLGYGRLHFDCRFVDDLYLPAINKPYRLVKAAHTARMRHPRIDYGEKDLELDIDAIERKRRQVYWARQKAAAIKQSIMPKFKKSA